MIFNDLDSFGLILFNNKCDKCVGLLLAKYVFFFLFPVVLGERAPPGRSFWGKLGKRCGRKLAEFSNILIEACCLLSR